MCSGITIDFGTQASCVGSRSSPSLLLCIVLTLEQPAGGVEDSLQRTYRYRGTKC